MIEYSETGFGKRTSDGSLELSSITTVGKSTRYRATAKSSCYTRSTDGDVTNQHGEGDVWLVKLAADGEKISPSNETTSLNELKNYPNPFSQSTLITFQLSTDENVSLKIFDLGKEDLFACLRKSE